MAGVTDGGYLRFDWRIGTGQRIAKSVCRMRFLLSYDLKPTYLLSLTNDIKLGCVNSDPTFNDSAAPAPDDYLKSVIQLAASNGIVLSRDHLAMIQMPNTVLSVEGFGWMEFYFNLMGDFIPNSNGEIHLEPIDVKDIYSE